MKGRNFEDWLNTFRPSISSYTYYTDFEKVYDNVKALKPEINLLGTLVGKKHIKQKFKDLLDEHPKCVKAIPILLAVRKKHIYCQDERGAVNYSFKPNGQTKKEYVYFMEETGLFDLLQNHISSNLYDYVLGVEAGLDSNGRKNRGGDQMEDLVERFLQKSGVTYFKEMDLTEIEDTWGVDLSAISAEGTSTKRWDFVVKTERHIYVIETNFYTDKGSKLNETARSYKMIAKEAKEIDGFSFVWITDGEGWFHARRSLKETFQVLKHLYNIADLENGLFDRLFQSR